MAPGAAVEGNQISSPGPPCLSTAYFLVLRPILGVLLTAVVFVPVILACAVVALAVAWDFRDPRRVIFAQERVGHRGQAFTIYKFRTMKDAQGGNFQSWEQGVEQERVTRLGSLLRRSHLDELPQFLNILRGEMAYIGPRPEMVSVHKWALESVPGFDARLWVKPGITGLAQLGLGYVGSDEAAYGHKLKADLEYLSRLSLMQDFGILARTPIWMLRLRGWGGLPSVVMAPVNPSHAHAGERLGRRASATMRGISRVS